MFSLAFIPSLYIIHSCLQTSISICSFLQDSQSRSLFSFPLYSLICVLRYLPRQDCHDFNAMLFDESPNPTATWHPEPNSRGTFSILSSCLITLGLCTWSAVHMNVPNDDNLGKRSKWDLRRWLLPQLRRRFGWMISGMLAPEMVRTLLFL